MLRRLSRKKQGFIFKGHRNNGNNMPQGPAHYNRQPIEHGPPNLIKVIPFYAMWIVFILVLVIYLVNRQGNSDQTQQEAALLTLKQSTAALNTKVTQAPTNIAENNSTAPTDNNAAEQDNAPQSNVFKITLRAKNHVWVEVKATSTGESLYNSFLEPGDSRDFTDKEGLWVRAGNGGNVIVTAAGKTAELGAPGKITEKTFASSNKINQVDRKPG